MGERFDSNDTWPVKIRVVVRESCQQVVVRLPQPTDSTGSSKSRKQMGRRASRPADSQQRHIFSSFGKKSRNKRRRIKGGRERERETVQDDDCCLLSTHAILALLYSPPSSPSAQYSHTSSQALEFS